MHTVKLHKTDFSLMLKLVPTDITLSLQYYIGRDFCFVKAPLEVIEKIIDKLSGQLSSKGYDDEYQPNYLGSQIEHLITIFSTEVYSQILF